MIDPKAHIHTADAMFIHGAPLRLMVDIQNEEVTIYELKNGNLMCLVQVKGADGCILMAEAFTQAAEKLNGKDTGISGT